MKKVIRLTENDLVNIVKRVIKETEVRDETNEEIDLKRALVGGALAASTILSPEIIDYMKKHGYELPQLKRNDTEVVDDNKVDNSEVVDDKQVPDSDTHYRIVETPNLGYMEMEISIGGTLTENNLSSVNSFTYYGKDGKMIAEADQWGDDSYSTISITDNQGKEIGSILMSWLHGDIKDANGNIIAKFSPTNVKTITMVDNKGGVVKMDNELSAVHSWKLDITSKIDKRLYVFIPAFVSLSEDQEDEEDE